MFDSTAIQMRQEERSDIAQKTAEFLARGNAVRVLSHIERAPQKVSVWQSSMNHKLRREGEKRAIRLGQRIRELALVDAPELPIHGKLRTPLEIRRLLRAEGDKINSPEVEMLAARFCVELGAIHDDGAAK